MILPMITIIIMKMFLLFGRYVFNVNGIWAKKFINCWIYFILKRQQLKIRRWINLICISFACILDILLHTLMFCQSYLRQISVQLNSWNFLLRFHIYRTRAIYLIFIHLNQHWIFGLYEYFLNTLLILGEILSCYWLFSIQWSVLCHFCKIKKLIINSIGIFAIYMPKNR